MQGIVKEKINDLILYENNAKIHSEYQVNLIAKSIKEFGFINPVLIDKNKNVIAGHGRIEAAKVLKMKTVPTITIEGLDEIERRAYILADNRLSELAEWDDKLIAAELKELKESNFDTDITGFLYDDIDFSFLDADNDQAAPKQPREQKNCECPRCKCVFNKKEIIKHGNELAQS